MGRKLPEQQAFRYDDDHVPVRRRSATPEELATRRATTGEPGRARQPGQRVEEQPLPASTHRAGHYAGIHPEDQPYMTQEGRLQRPSRYSLPVDLEAGGDYQEPERSRTTVVRYPLQARPQQTRNIYHPARETRALPRRSSWALYAGVIPLALVVIGFFGFVVLSGLGNWWQTQRDDWTYGRPRTYQADAVVGHDDSKASPSHFIAVKWD